MTRQKRATPKYRWTGRLTLSNYDYLAFKSIREGVSMAKLLNQIVEQARRPLSDITICNPKTERVTVN